MATPGVSPGGSSTQTAKPEVAPFVNKGLVLKTDAASLQPGEFQRLDNMSSVQEGALTVRNGSQRITDQSQYGGDTINWIHSITKLHGSNPDARYIGSDGNIYRSTTAIPSSGTAMPFTKVATGCAPSGAYTTQRFTGIRYNAGTVGQPWEFFACPSKMLKDNGSLSSLWNWGIVRPVQPAIAALDAITILPAPTAEVISGHDRVNTTISSFTGTAPGILTVTPADMSEIQVGTLLAINFGYNLVSVLATTSTTFTGYFANTPTLGWGVSSGQTTVTAPTQFSTFTGFGTIDASFNGASATGYSSPDPLHVALAISDASTLLDLRVRVLLNSSTSDYYEKAISTSSIQSQVSLTTTPVATLTTVAQQINLGIYGPYENINLEAAQAAPVTLSPTSPVTNVNVVWNEIDIPKNSFLPVGLAGTGSFNWKYVTGFQIVYTVSSGATPTLYASSLYFKGGFGPNGLSTTANVPVQPYTYCYCVTPDTPVLCDDLVWREAGSLKEGQGIISFDEKEALYERKRTTRRYRKAKIVCNVPEQKECYEIRTNIGDPVKASADHPWLVWNKKRKVDGLWWDGLEWKCTKDLRPGDKIAHFDRPWKEELSKSAGWLAGMFDGEGSIGVAKTKYKGQQTKQWNLNIAQKQGDVLDRIKTELEVRGFKYYQRDQIKAKGHECSYLTITGGFRKNLRLLGTIRPNRLLEKFESLDNDYYLGLMQKRTYDLAEVVSVVPIGMAPVASIQTSNGTFITGGYLSHNTYRNPVTGDESSPSQIPISGVTPNYQQVAVKLYGTADAQVTGKSSIAVYRAGGAFADDFYRFIGYAINPGHASTTVFYDAISDDSIASNNLANFDNDPPVLSTLPNPFTATISSIISGGAGQMTVFQVTLPSGVSNLGNLLTVGSTMHITSGSSGAIINSEDVYVVDTSATDGGLSASQVRVFTQYTHYTGDYVEVDAITGQPCNLGCAAFDSLFVAGDPNNPHILYKSKTGAPAAFPVVELATGIADQIIVGSPSNPIMAVTEFGGQIISLNLSNIFVISLFAGAMQNPVETPAQRGLAGNAAWCKADNEVWYVSYDGIYSWSGGYSYKRSEKIDPLFKGFQIGPYLPIDTNNLQYCTLSYYRNEIRFVYLDSDENYLTLKYNTVYDRWNEDIYYDSLVANEITAPTAQYAELDTGILLDARSLTISSTLWSFLYVVDVGSSDGWTSSAMTDGAAIVYYAKGAGYELGYSSLQKQYSDIVLEFANDTVSSNAPTLTLACYYDWSATANVTDTFTITSSSGAGRRRQPFSLQNGFGMAAYVMEIALYGTTVVPVTFYSLTFNYFPLNQIQAGRAYDWDDLGYPYDKRLYELTVEFNVASGTESLILDVMTGIAGSQTIAQGVQTFTLSPPSGTFTGPSRVQATFPMNDAIIVKKVRLRPAVNTTYFQAWQYKFEFEKYPSDIAYQTEWSDYGNPYEKYAQQAVFEVNTNNVAATVKLYADGSLTASATFNVTSTTEDRNRIITLPPNIVGKRFRFVITPGGGGSFQLFKQDLITVPADRGPVYHTFDWDNMGYPWDKKLRQLTIEYNTAGGGSPVTTTIYGDTMTGIQGGTINTQALTFSLNQSGRALQTFPIPDGVVVKQVRLYPATDNIYFQEWKPQWDFEKYPADISPWTEWTDFEWPCEKIARNLLIEVDTGGVAASVQLQADGSNAGSPISITTTSLDRRRVIALSSDLIGRNFRLVNTPGFGGKFQLFNWNLDVVREPCAVLYYDSYETDFGYDGYKFLKQAWLWYKCAGQLDLVVYVDGFTPFLNISLPANTYRDAQRLYFPAINSGVLNKSVHYRIQLTSDNPFKLYAGSVIEWGAFGADQRAAYRQFPLTAEQQLPVAGIQI